MSVGIYSLLEGRDASTAEGVEEAFARLALAEIDLDQSVDGARHPIIGQGRA
jgi:hypothetical protein